MACQHPGFEGLLGFEYGNVDLDARLLFECGNGVGGHIISPDVEVKNLIVTVIRSGGSIFGAGTRVTAAEHEDCQYAGRQN